MIGVALGLFALVILLCGVPNQSVEALYYDADFEALYDEEDSGCSEQVIKGHTTERAIESAESQSNVQAPAKEQPAAEETPIDAQAMARQIYNSVDM